MPAHLIDTTFVAGAGGSVRFYQPGTLIQANVFSNDAATFILTQPIALDADGKTVFPVYTTQPVRAVFFDPNGAQLLDVERDNGERAEITSLVNTFWPVAETVDDALTEIAVSLGSTDGLSTASFQGAVPRTIQARLQDYVNVKDFGAKGDGTTLDDAAIARALLFIGNQPAGRGFTIRFPAGTYLIQGTLFQNTFNSDLTVQGDGKGATIIKANNMTVGSLMNPFSNFPFNLRDISLTNTTTSTGSCIDLTTVVGTTVDTVCTFSNVSISGWRIGVDAFNGRATLVDIATDNNAAGSGFRVGAIGGIFNSCSMSDASAASAGIRVPAGKGGGGQYPGLMVTNCYLPNTTSRGILLEAGHNVTRGAIIGNHFGGFGGVVGGITTNADTRGLPGVRISGNFGVYAVVELAGSTDIITNPAAGILGIDLAKSKYQKATIIAATAITYINPAAGTAVGPSHDEIFTIVLQNSTGGGFAITAGTNVTLQTGGFTVAATSQSVVQFQYDSNANRLIQVTAPVAMAVT